MGRKMWRMNSGHHHISPKHLAELKAEEEERRLESARREWEEAHKDDYGIGDKIGMALGGLMVASGVVAVCISHYADVRAENRDFYENQIGRYYEGPASISTHSNYSLANFKMLDGSDRLILIEHAGENGGEQLAKDLKADEVENVYAAVFTDFHNADAVLEILNPEKLVINPNVAQAEHMEYLNFKYDAGKTFDVIDRTNFDTHAFEAALNGVMITFEGKTACMEYDSVVYMASSDAIRLTAKDAAAIQYLITDNESLARGMGEQGYIVCEGTEFTIETDGISFHVEEEQMAQIEADFEEMELQ